MQHDVNAPQPPLDGRSERWRDHRIQRRAEFVDAALRALAKHGPDVHIAQIAAEAGVAKPKLYRHFEDKADVLDAVQGRISELLWHRMNAVLDPADAPSHLVRAMLDAFLGLVDEYPEVFRLLLHPARQVSVRTSEKVLADGAKLADVLHALITGLLGRLDVNTEVAGPAAHALTGGVGATTLWWLEHRTMSKAALIEHLATIILGALDAVLRSAGVVLDFDEPLGSERPQ